MLKMAMVVYNEALGEEVMGALESAGLRNYTKATGIFGRGAHSGTHEGSDIWPGRNNILYVACTQGESEKLMRAIKDLRKKLAHEGIKAFIFPLEEAT